MDGVVNTQKAPGRSARPKAPPVHPLLPLRVVADRNRGGAYLSMFLASAGTSGVFLFLTYYLETALGYSAVRAGLAFLPMTGMIMIIASIGLATRCWRSG